MLQWLTPRQIEVLVEDARAAGWEEWEIEVRFGPVLDTPPTPKPWPCDTDQTTP